MIWHPIDTLPAEKRGRIMVVYAPPYVENPVPACAEIDPNDSDFWSVGYWGEKDGGWIERPFVTHWAELPEMPTGHNLNDSLNAKG